MPSFNGKRIKIGSSGVVPPTLLEERKIPKFYQKAIALCGVSTLNQFPDTGLVYNLISASDLPQDVLSNIWSLVNRTLPGRLTRQEFYSCLALIALAQKGESLSALCDVSSLPIPSLKSSIENIAKIGKVVKNNSLKKSPKKMLESLTIQNLKIPKKTITSNSSNYNSNGQISLTQKTMSNMYNDILSIDNSINVIQFDVKNNDYLKNLDSLFTIDNQERIANRITVWKSCLNEAIIVFADAFELICTNKIHFDNIFLTKNGTKFLNSLTFMYFVVLRILTSIKISLATLQSVSNTLLISVLDKNTLALENAESMASLLLQSNLAQEKWNNLQEFFPEHLKKEEEFKIFNLKKELKKNFDISVNNENKNTWLCYLCLQRTNINEIESTKIQIVDKTYHSQCANFYINKVGSVLPKLI